MAEVIRSYRYFATIVDETTDISHIEQVSICFRHLNDNFSDLQRFYWFVRYSMHRCRSTQQNYQRCFAENEFITAKFKGAVL